jgi:hypothetical protein
MRVLTVLILGLALTGCGTLYDAPPQRPMKLASDDVSSQKWCHNALLLMDSPVFDPDSKAAVAKEMKIRGCPIPR